MKRLLELAVTNVHLKCNKSWFCQKDGLAMGAPLAVILDNLWMKSWEPQLKLRTFKCKTNAQWSTCRNCEHRVTACSRGVECEICDRWFHAKCQRISNTENDSMENQFWMCFSALKMIRLTFTIRPKLSFSKICRRYCENS